MSIPQLETIDQSIFSVSGSLRWWDTDTGCTLIVSRPETEPDLWSEYLRGAQRSYRAHGVECVLNIAAIRSGEDTSLFFAAVEKAGNVVGGLRAKGPLDRAEESHALIEWAGQPGLGAVRKMISDRLPFGVVEMKSAWVDHDFARRRLLTETLARTAYPAMALLGAQFLMATAATHVLDRWRSSGGVVAKIPATPYPDERYRTKMMWWDRTNFVKHAASTQASKIVMEMKELEKVLNGQGEALMLGGSAF